MLCLEKASQKETQRNRQNKYFSKLQLFITFDGDEAVELHLEMSVNTPTLPTNHTDGFGFFYYKEKQDCTHGNSHKL